MTAAVVATVVAGPGPAWAGGARPGVIRTVAGGFGGPTAGPLVAVAQPCGVTSAGHDLYFTEASNVRKLDVRTGVLSVAVGAGPAGTKMANGLGGCDIAMDRAGNLVVTSGGFSGGLHVKAARDGVFYGIRMRAGHIYQIPPVVQNIFYQGVAIDRHGNLLVTSVNLYYVGDPDGTDGSATLWVVAGARGTFYGRAMVPGKTYRLAGRFCKTTGPFDCGSGFGGDGGPALDATFGQDLQGMALDGNGNVLISDSENNRVRLVAVRAGSFYGQAMKAGHIYSIAGGGSGGIGDGGPATTAALSSPQGLAVDRAGNIVVADSLDRRVRLVAASSGRFYGQRTTAGDIYTIAGNGLFGYSGDGGPARQAAFRSPTGLALNAGNVAIADQANNRVRVLAAGSGEFYGRKMTAGHIYTVAGSGKVSYSGDGGPAILAQFQFGTGGAAGNALAVSPAGNTVVADSLNERVRVIAAASGVYYGRKMTAGHIYAVGGTGVRGFSGDGGPAVRARLQYPGAVTVDRAGNILVSDEENARLRVIAARTGRFYGRHMIAGYIYTIAGGGNGPQDGVPATLAYVTPVGAAVDSQGNVVLATTAVTVIAEKTGTFYGEKMTAGDIYTLNPKPVNGFEIAPDDIAIDHAGNIVVAGIFGDVGVIAVKAGRFYGLAMRPGHLYMVAGNPQGKLGFSGDGGPATKAELLLPEGVAVDAAGNLLIAVAGNNRIRVVAERSGTFYGVKMTAGDIYTVAGGGRFSFAWKGFAGDGGQATKASLAAPGGIAVYGNSLLVLDSGDNRLRRVSN